MMIFKINDKPMARFRFYLCRSSFLRDCFKEKKSYIFVNIIK